MSESRRPSSLPSRWAVLTMPVVTVFCRAKGLPMATTNSPGRRSAECPSSNTGSFFWKEKKGVREDRGSDHREGSWQAGFWRGRRLFTALRPGQQLAETGAGVHRAKAHLRRPKLSAMGRYRASRLVLAYDILEPRDLFSDTWSLYVALANIELTI